LKTERLGGKAQHIAAYRVYDPPLLECLENDIRVKRSLREALRRSNLGNATVCWCARSPRFARDDSMPMSLGEQLAPHDLVTQSCLIVAPVQGSIMVYLCCELAWRLARTLALPLHQSMVFLVSLCLGGSLHTAPVRHPTMPYCCSRARVDYGILVLRIGMAARQESRPPVVVQPSRLQLCRQAAVVHSRTKASDDACSTR